MWYVDDNNKLWTRPVVIQQRLDILVDLLLNRHASQCQQDQGMIVTGGRDNTTIDSSLSGE
jgi:hypothetical protein